MNARIANALHGVLWTVAILAAPAPFGATTSATVSGYVRSADGEPIAAARIDIVHRPSGTAATAATAENGAFYQSGLRLGGPYEIRFSADGYRDRKLDDLTLKPGAQPPLAVTLTTLDIEEVVVTAGRFSPTGSSCSSPTTSSKPWNRWTSAPSTRTTASSRASSRHCAG